MLMCSWATTINLLLPTGSQSCETASSYTIIRWASFLRSLTKCSRPRSIMSLGTFEDTEGNVKLNILRNALSGMNIHLPFLILVIGAFSRSVISDLVRKFLFTIGSLNAMQSSLHIGNGLRLSIALRRNTIWPFAGCQIYTSALHKVQIHKICEPFSLNYLNIKLFKVLVTLK